MEKLTHINQLKAASEGATKLLSEINSSLEALAPKYVELKGENAKKYTVDYISKQKAELKQLADSGPLTNIGKLKALHEQVNSSADYFTKSAVLSRQEYFTEYKSNRKPITESDKMAAHTMQLHHATAEDTRRTRLVTELSRVPNSALANEIQIASETNDLMKLSVAIQEHRIRNYGDDRVTSKATGAAIDNAMKALDFPEHNAAQQYLNNVELAYREASMTYDKVVKGKNTSADKIALGLAKGEDGMNVKRVA